MLKGNNIKYLTIVILGGLCLCAYNPQEFTTRLQKKIKASVNGTYGLEEHTLMPYKIDSETEVATAVSLENHFFKVNKNQETVGYIYVGQTPSMKNVFDYIILFTPEWEIKKSKVLIYRENYGLQIGSQRWLKQFIGLNTDDILVYGENIDGIAGATISASSMTKATNDVLTALKVLKKKSLIE